MSDDIQKQDAPQAARPGRAGGARRPGGDRGRRAAAGGDQPAAGPLTPTDLQRVAELSRQVDVSDTQAVLAYGLPAQSRIANFADSLLGDVRTQGRRHRRRGAAGPPQEGARDRRRRAERRLRQGQDPDPRPLRQHVRALLGPLPEGRDQPREDHRRARALAHGAAQGHDRARQDVRAQPRLPQAAGRVHRRRRAGAHRAAHGQDPGARG